MSHKRGGLPKPGGGYDVSDAESAVDVTAADVGAVPSASVGQAGGVASLDVTGKVPAEQLPAASQGSPALGETQTTAYRGDRGKTAYDHSQAPHETVGAGAAAVAAHDSALSPHSGKFDASGAAAAVSTALGTHAGLTTAAHGGIVASGDSRLTDARTPVAHDNSKHSTAYLASGTPYVALPFVIVPNTTALSPADAATLFRASGPEAAVATTTRSLLGSFVVPIACTLAGAYIVWNAATVAGSAENVIAYVRLNNTTDLAIATVGSTAALKTFAKSDFAQALVAGDRIELKILCPTWATNPTGVTIWGSIYCTKTL